MPALFNRRRGLFCKEITVKPGANFEEVNQIKAGFKKGMTAEEISSVLRISVECVQSFEPKKRAPKSKQ